MARLELRLLGGLEARLEGQALEFPTRHSALLLAYLALAPDKSHSRETLAALLWGDRAEEQARGSLRQTTYLLRQLLKSLEPTPLEGDVKSLRLRGEVLWCDAAAFKQAIKGDGAALEEAFELYRGDLLATCGAADPDFESWLLMEREAYRRLAIEGFLRLATAQRACRNFPAMEATARKLIAIDRFDEAGYRALMTAIALQDQRNAALTLYQDLCDLLKRELNVEPRPETTGLAAAIRDGEALVSSDPAGGVGDQREVRETEVEPPVVTSASAPSNFSDDRSHDNEPSLLHSPGPAAASAAEASHSGPDADTSASAERNPEQEIAGTARPADRPRRRAWVVAAGMAAALILTLGVVYWGLEMSSREAPASLERMAFPLPDKPSIAVLPFDDLSPDSSPEFLADAITNDIITDLSRFRDFVVIASNSTFAYKGRAVKVQQVAEELGVRYVIEGSLQTAGDKVRLNVQLIDALTGKHLWAERYSLVIADVFTLQDEITEKVVGTLGGLDGRIADAILGAARSKGTHDLTAYEYLVLATETRYQFTAEGNVKAGELCQKSIDRDPSFSRAYVCLAFVHYLDWIYGWSKDPDLSMKQGFDAARKAVALDDTEAEAHWVLADMFWISEQPEQAIASYARAMELNPNNADVLAEWGWNMVFLTGEADKAVANIKRAMRLNPHHSDWYEQGLGLAAYAARRYEEAVAALEKVTYHAIDSRAAFAASYAQLGRMEEARQQLAEILKLQPDFSISGWIEKNRFQLPEMAQHFRDGLEKAGLPDRSE